MFLCLGSWKAAVDVVRAPPQRVQDRIREACVVDTVGSIKGLDKHNMPRSGDVRCPRLGSKSRLSTLVRQGSFGKLQRRKLWTGSGIQQRLLEQNMEAFKITPRREFNDVFRRCRTSSWSWRTAASSGTRR